MILVFRTILVGLAVTASVTPGMAIAADPAAVPVADHHMHLFSPAASHVLELICQAKKAKGDEGCAPEVSHAPSTGSDAIAALDQAGIRRGVILSAGYFFGSPDVPGQHADVAKQTRDENRYIVEQAKAHCGRLVPVISVDPLAPSAVAEVDFWGRRGGAAALKIHLGNSGLDFRKNSDVKQLAAVFAAADRNHLAIIIHLQTSPHYDPQDTRIFLSEVAPFARHVPIQIAHIGSGGGLDRGVLDILGVFAEEFRTEPMPTKNIFFDMAMVPDLFSNTRKLVATPADVAALEVLMRRIGLDRFVLGSDFTLGLNLAAYYADQRATLSLAEPEWRRLASNEAPYLSFSATDRACGVNITP